MDRRAGGGPMAGGGAGVGGVGGVGVGITGTSNLQTEAGEATEILQLLARDRMEKILGTRALKGCPLNIPFTDIEDIVAKVGSVNIVHTYCSE